MSGEPANFRLEDAARWRERRRPSWQRRPVRSQRSARCRSPAPGGGFIAKAVSVGKQRRWCRSSSAGAPTRRATGYADRRGGWSAATRAQRCNIRAGQIRLLASSRFLWTRRRTSQSAWFAREPWTKRSCICAGTIRQGGRLAYNSEIDDTIDRGHNSREE